MSRQNGTPAEPQVPASLLTYLRSVFPDRGYVRGDDLAAVAYKGGHHAVIDHLQDLHDEQHARASRTERVRETRDTTTPFTET